MKCHVRDDELTVNGRFRTRFNAPSNDIVEVKLITERDYYGPFSSLYRWLFGNQVRLRFIMLATSNSEITVDLRQDTGGAEVIEWLKAAGWDIAGALQEAMKIPLVRQRVVKVSSR